MEKVCGCTKAIVLFAIRDGQIRLIIDNSKPEIMIEPALLQVLIGIDYGKICQPQIFAKGDMTL